MCKEVIQSEVFQKWLMGLKDKRARGLIEARLNRLGFGLLGDVSRVGEGIHELRIHYGPGYRIYFYNQDRTIVVLLCGGDKSTQKKDIEMARRLALKWSEQNEIHTI